LTKPKEPSISEIAEKATKKHFEERARIIASLKKRKGVDLSTLSCNPSRGGWMITIKGERIALEEEKNGKPAGK
jgi:hypothetical protein